MSRKSGSTQKAPKLCCYPGCELPALLVSRCHLHFPGYKPTWSPYKTSWWRTTRKQFIENHPFCADPFCRHAEPVPASCVDHIVRHQLHLDRFMDLANLQSLCESCHTIKTGLELDLDFGTSKRRVALWFKKYDLHCVPTDEPVNGSCYLCHDEILEGHLIGRVVFCESCCPCCPAPRRRRVPERQFRLSKAELQRNAAFCRP